MSMWILSAPGSVAYSLGFRPFWRSGKQKGGFPDTGVFTFSSSLVFLPASHLTNIHLKKWRLATAAKPLVGFNMLCWFVHEMNR